MKNRLLALVAVLSRPAVAIGGSLAVAVFSVALAWYLTSVSPSGSYVSVVRAPINQEVDVTGTVSAAHDTDLSFPSAGQVAAVYVTVGQHVGMGQTLAVLNHGAQSAALEGAEANLAVAQARLASIQAGTRPEQIAIDTQAVANAQSSAYITADSAVHTTADTVFTNGRSASAALVPTVPDATLSAKLINERVALEPVLMAWTPSTDVVTAQKNLMQVSAFLDDLARALALTQSSASFSASSLTTSQSAIASARASVSGALTALTSASGALTLAQAGATAQDIAVAQATVAGAQASVDAAKVAVGNTFITAPLSGTVTRQEANLGATVSPNVPLISLIADGKFEVTASVSEADIAKLKIGNSVSVTFPSQGVSLPATLTEVSPTPALGGVAGYEIKATFTQNDPRIVSGLTVSLSVATGTNTDALVIPTSAIITDNTQKFVYVQAKGGDRKVAVTTGISSSAGMTEIISGLSEGDRVLAFGSASAK